MVVLPVCAKRIPIFLTPSFVSFVAHSYFRPPRW